MAHKCVRDVIEHAEDRTGFQIVFIIGGGVLLLTALVAAKLFSHPFHASIVAMIAAVSLGAPLIREALSDLWKGESQMGALAALAFLAAFASGSYITAGAISFFMVISALIEQRSALGAQKSIEALIRLSPTVARRINDAGKEEEIETSKLVYGDRVRVRPGDNMPADGVVLTGESTLNQASITGESIPAEKTEGDDVFAGTINMTGVLEIEIRKTGEDTTLGQVKRLILQAEATRTPVMRLIDRHAKWYVPLMLMLAGSVLFFTRDIDRAVAMLVIACPCAIVICGPTATVAALSAAARLGLLIKNVSDLEIARRLTAIVFDKTGTLTTGRLHVARIETNDGHSAKDVLSIAAALEINSRHPAARAVVAEAEKRGITLTEGVEGFSEASGKGVEGRIGGTMVLVGRIAWLREHGIDVDEIDSDDVAGLSILHIAVDGREVGWIGLEDRIRPGAANAISGVEQCGIKKRVMLTGDRWAVARRVGQAVGCTDVLAEILPDEKMESVEMLKKDGHLIAVVGDGVNDAPALAAGDVSIAMGAAGSDAAIHSASIALMNNELNRIPFLLDLSRRTMAVITQNLFFSVACVVVFLGLSAAGYIHPVLAVILHTASALVVIVNSARLIRAGEAVHDDDTVPADAADKEKPELRTVAVSMAGGVQWARDVWNLPEAKPRHLPAKRNPPKKRKRIPTSPKRHSGPRKRKRSQDIYMLHMALSRPCSALLLRLASGGRGWYSSSESLPLPLRCATCGFRLCKSWRCWRDGLLSRFPRRDFSFCLRGAAGRNRPWPPDSNIFWPCDGSVCSSWPDTVVRTLDGSIPYGISLSPRRRSCFS